VLNVTKIKFNYLIMTLRFLKVTSSFKNKKNLFNLLLAYAMYLFGIIITGTNRK
jgi:hypothetical protein